MLYVVIHSNICYYVLYAIKINIYITKMQNVLTPSLTNYMSFKKSLLFCISILLWEK